MFSPRFGIAKLLILTLILGTGAVVYYDRPSADTTGACPIAAATPGLNTFPSGQFDKDGLGTLRFDDNESLKVYRVGDQATIQLSLVESEPIWDANFGTALSFGDAHVAGGYGEVKIEPNMSGYTEIVDYSPKDVPGVAITKTPWDIVWKVTSPLPFNGGGSPTGLMRGGNRTADPLTGPFTVTLKFLKTSEQLGANGIGQGFQWLPVKASVGRSGFQNFLLIRDERPYALKLTGPANYAGSNIFDITVQEVSRWTVVEEMAVENGTFVGGIPLYFYPTGIYPPRIHRVKPDGSDKEIVVKLKGKSWCGTAQTRLVIPPTGLGYGEAPNQPTDQPVSLTINPSTSSSSTASSTPTAAPAATSAVLTTPSEMPTTSPSATTPFPTTASSSPTVASTPSTTSESPAPQPSATTTSPQVSVVAEPDATPTTGADPNPVSTTSQPSSSPTSLATSIVTPITPSPSSPTSQSSNVVTTTNPDATPLPGPTATILASESSSIPVPAPETNVSVESVTVAGKIQDLSQPVTVTAGTPIQVGVIQGSSAPGETVTVYVYSEPKVYTVTADSTGHWSLEIPTAELEAGLHRIEYETPTKSRVELMQFTVTQEKEVLAPLAGNEAAAPNDVTNSLLTTAAQDSSLDLLHRMPLWMWIVGGLIIAFLIFIFLHVRRLAAHNLHETDGYLSER